MRFRTTKHETKNATEKEQNHKATRSFVGIVDPQLVDPHLWLIKFGGKLVDTSSAREIFGEIFVVFCKVGSFQAVMSRVRRGRKPP